MSKIIAWLAGTRIGRWLIGMGAVILAALALAYTMFLKGKHAQADVDAARHAKEIAESAQVAHDVYRAASDAAAKVQADAAKQPPPDPVKRDDLNTNF